MVEWAWSCIRKGHVVTLPHIAESVVFFVFYHDTVVVNKQCDLESC